MTTQSPVRLGTRDVVGLGLVASLVPMNSTMIAVALPDIGDDFDIASGTAGYLITVYLFVMLIGQPVAGRVADRIGLTVSLYGSLVGFTAASIAASLAGTFALLVLFRALQAACATLFMPGSQAMVRSYSPTESRGRNMGIIGACIGIGAGLGPVVGGLVTAIGGWQGVFLVNLPLAAVALFLLLTLPNPASTRTATENEAPAGVRSVVTQPVFMSAYGTQATATYAQYSLLLVVPLVL
ncbi:MAG: MFS transporter, partial [Acidimicrobiales bacterium]